MGNKIHKLKSARYYSKTLKRNKQKNTSTRCFNQIKYKFSTKLNNNLHAKTDTTFANTNEINSTEIQHESV